MRSMNMLVLAVVLAGCGNDYATNPSDGTPDVVDAVGVTAWNPATITIKAGNAVTFRNNSATQHNVRFDQAEAGSPEDVPNFASSSKAVTFAAAGTFAFHCGIHPAMQGQVIVTP